MKPIKKTESKKKTGNKYQDIRKYCKTENDCEEERADENDCDVKRDAQVELCVNQIENIPVTIIERETQQPNIDRKIVPGESNNDITVHLYS